MSIEQELRERANFPANNFDTPYHEDSQLMLRAATEIETLRKQIIRIELEKELGELVAKNEAAKSWGAAVGARHERIKEIRGLLSCMPRELETPSPDSGEQD